MTSCTVAAADASDLVGCHRDTNAAATDAQTGVGITVAHRPPDRSTEVGIIDPIIGVGAAVDDFMAGRPDVVGELLLEVEPGMIRTNSDAHAVILGPTLALSPAFGRRRRSRPARSP